MDKEKLNIFKAQMEILGNTVTKTEFLKLVKTIVDEVSKIDKRNLAFLDSLNTTFDKLGETLKGKNAEDFEAVKKQFVDWMNGFISEHMARMKTDMETHMKAMSGHDAKCDEEHAKMSASMEEMQGEMDQMKKDMPVMPEMPKEKTPQEIRDALESLDGTERLRIEAIKDLEERLKQLENRPIGGKSGGGFSYIAMDSHFIDDETPSGTVNGVNTDFTITGLPSPSSSLKVYVNGARMRVTEDYTVSGKTITFLTAPPTGSILLVDYRTQ